jgi:hypothetical protein
MTMTCRDAELLLHDALDRTLTPAEASALAAHLESCGTCRDLQADLALIHQAAGALDRPILPAGSWPRLATRLESEGLLAATGRAAGTSSAPPRAWRSHAWIAIAATLLAGVGAAIVWRAQQPAPTPSIATHGTTAPAGGNARDPRAVEAIETELQMAAAHYERAIAKLEALAAEDRTQLDPAVAQVVERSLVLIDKAIADSRTALQGQPGSLQAQESLFDAYRRKVALLQDLIALASDAKRTGAEGALATRDRS